MTEYPPQAWAAYQKHRPAIERILDPALYTIGWLDNQLLNQHAMAFGSEDAVIVIELKVYPTNAVEMHGLVASGDLDAIMILIDEAERWARSHGIRYASIASRPAWSRLLKRKGYEVHQVVVRKGLV